MKELLHSIEKILGIYRWHPKIALRYLPVVDELRKQFSENYAVLEVGSAGLGIVPYLKKRVVGLDITFPPPIHPDLVPVKASATDIPFATNSFDAVISLDMLEHISPVDRTRVLSEMIRVAKSFCCIGVPSGALSQLQDQELEELYKKKHKKDFHFLEEQVEYGLPTREWLFTTIEDEAKKLHKKIAIKNKGNINLKLRKFLMRGWISNNFLVSIIFRKVFLLFIPIMRQLNGELTYRQLFFITIHA